ncbi:hypothetical protein ACFQJ5_19395 [Halomicroarcula sp. GCM10025324]|uniref:hypothetical protein n=1 Tax=Halomicroarcula sp. GCM10025324 TaxID=3252667 RepID=UPI00360C6A0C
MSSETLTSIRRWLMVIALFFAIRVYYLAKNGYNDAAVDTDDNLIGFFAVICAIIIIVMLIASAVNPLSSEAN